MAQKKAPSDALLDSQKVSIDALKTLSSLPEVRPESLAGEQILAIDKMRLLYFEPSSTEALKHPPLLICYALVNRPYILDLEPERSLLRDLLRQGVPVYLIDWGYPDLTDYHLSLEDYLLDYLDSAVSQVCAHSKSDTTGLLGICQGGVFATCYSALRPERIAKLITLVTPFDTEVKDFTLAHMIRSVDVNQLAAAQGNIPGSMLNQIYASLKPLQLGIYKQLNLANNLTESSSAARYLRMEHWINDSPDLAGRAASEFAEQFFKLNGLVNRCFTLADKTIDLSNLRAPVLNIFGEKDHLVPPASSRALQKLLPDALPYEELKLPGGHIGAFVSNRGRKRASEAISDWLRN